MKTVLATAADEVIRLVQRFFVQVTGAVARLRNHQHIVLFRGAPDQIISR